MNKRVWWSAVLALSAASFGCASSKKVDNHSDASVSDAGGGTGGGSGSTVTTDAGKIDAGKADAGTPPVMTAMPVPCGSNTCQSFAGGAAAGFTSPAACCSNAATGTCGTVGASGTCDPPPTPDPRCPSVTVVGMTVTACCASNGQCGIDASMIGMGCADLASLAAGPLGSFIALPPPRACAAGGDDGGIGNDGG